MEKSRLACQIELKKDLDGIIIELPEDVTNMMEIPVKYFMLHFCKLKIFHVPVFVLTKKNSEICEKNL